MRASRWIVVAVTAFTGVAAPAAEAATLTATFTTTANGGNYAPNNVVAVWVEGPGGTFVRTIGRWSLARTQHLVAWNLKAGAGDADAVSGATRSNHVAPLTVSWNLTDKQGQVVADGTYTIRMELADANSNTAAQNRQGTFTFVKSGTMQVQSGLANGGFNNVSITFDPAGATPPPTNPPPSTPMPPSGGGPDAGVGTSSYDAVEGGCSAGGSTGAGLSVAFALLALRGSSRRARRRSGSR